MASLQEKLAKAEQKRQEHFSEKVARLMQHRMKVEAAPMRIEEAASTRAHVYDQLL